MYGHTYSKSMDQPSEVANPARGQKAKQNKDKIRDEPGYSSIFLRWVLAVHNI